MNNLNFGTIKGFKNTSAEHAERSRKAQRQLGEKYISRELVTGCAVVTETGEITSRHVSVLDGWDALNASPIYSVLVADDGTPLGKRMPALGGSERRMTASMERATAIMRSPKL